MFDPSVLDVSALTVLRLVVWANVAFAGALLGGMVLWLVCCGRELRSSRLARVSGPMKVVRQRRAGCGRAMADHAQPGSRGIP